MCTTLVSGLYNIVIIMVIIALTTGHPVYVLSISDVK